MHTTTSLVLSLIGPTIAVVFSIIFLCVRFYSRNQPYLGLLSLAFGTLGVGVASQVLQLPADSGWNTMVSAALYAASLLGLAEGVLQRSGRTMGRGLQLAAATWILFTAYYFEAVHPSMLARVYTLNFGVGTLLILVAVKLRRLRHGKPIDRLVWWTILLFGMHFFPRTLITAGAAVPSDFAALSHSTFWIVMQLSMAVCSVVLAFVLLTAALVDTIDTLKDDRDQDALTGLLNRRGFERQAIAQMARSGDTSISLMICDIDHFKAINDTYGHAAGDRVLQEFASLLKQSLRSIDVVGRIGGEEFVALLPDCDVPGGLFLIERLRRELNKKRYTTLPAGHIVTASFGMSDQQPLETLWDWLARTDTALYAAKATGRNRIAIQAAGAGIIHHAPDDDAEAPTPPGVVSLRQHSPRH